MTAGRSLLLQTTENQNGAADPADRSGFLFLRSNGCFVKPVRFPLRQFLVIGLPEGWPERLSGRGGGSQLR